MRCWPECCCMWSNRLFQSTLMWTLSPSARGAAMKWTAVAPLRTTLSTSTSLICWRNSQYRWNLQYSKCNFNTKNANTHVHTNTHAHTQIWLTYSPSIIWLQSKEATQIRAYTKSEHNSSYAKWYCKCIKGFHIVWVAQINGLSAGLSGCIH